MAKINDEYDESSISRFQKDEMKQLDYEASKKRIQTIIEANIEVLKKIWGIKEIRKERKRKGKGAPE